jgi:uncharacterized protein involved in response to NO
VAGLRLVLVSVMSTAATAISPATTVESTARMSAGIVMVVPAIAAGVMMMLARAIAGRVATAAEHPPRSRVAAVCVTAAVATRPPFREKDKEQHKGGQPENGQQENQEGRHGAMG